MFAERIVLALSVCITVLLLIVLLNPSTSPFNGPHNFYVWHPVLMVSGFLLILSQGVVAYVADYGSKLNAKFPKRSDRRTIHGVLQLVGTVFCITGWLVIVCVNSTLGNSNVGADVRSGVVSAHVWMGYITIATMVFQCGIGLWKFIVRERDEANVARWHTVLGITVYVVGTVTALLGVEFGFVELQSSRAWGIVIMTCICILVVIVVYTVLRGPMPKAATPQFTYIVPRHYRQLNG